MNKNLIMSIIGVVAVSGVVGLMFMGKSDNEPLVLSECSSLCADANATCPSLIDQGTCEAKCSGFSEETKTFLKEANSCEEMTARPDLLPELIIPEIPDAGEYEQKADTSGDCEAACGHYVSACLTLVPNVSEELFEDGFNSCMSECGGWESEKTECMLTAFDCEAMTNVCGL